MHKSIARLKIDCLCDDLIVKISTYLTYFDFKYSYKLLNKPIYIILSNKKHKRHLAKSQISNIMNEILLNSLQIDNNAFNQISKLYNNGSCATSYRRFHYIIENKESFFYKFKNKNKIEKEFNIFCLNYNKICERIHLSFLMTDWNRKLEEFEVEGIEMNTKLLEWFINKLYSFKNLDKYYLILSFFDILLNMKFLQISQRNVKWTQYKHWRQYEWMSDVITAQILKDMQRVTKYKCLSIFRWLMLLYDSKCDLMYQIRLNDFSRLSLSSKMYEKIDGLSLQIVMRVARYSYDIPKKFAAEIVWFTLFGSNCINIQEIPMVERIRTFNGLSYADIKCKCPKKNPWNSRIYYIAY